MFSIKKILACTMLAGTMMSVCALPTAVEAGKAADKNNSSNMELARNVRPMNLKWWQKTIVYEAYPSSFLDTEGNGIGDLKGITSKLDYLQQLGVGAIWLTPVFASPMGDNGYDVSDYKAINPLYGTMEDMEELIAEADKRHIKLVMDLVINHTSEECPWFKASVEEPDGKYGDWYIWRDPVEGHEPNNWGGIFGGSAWTWNEKRQQYYLHTFADFQPDLNWSNPEVRKAIYDVANFWLDKGVGGFRIDAVPYIKKPLSFADGPVNAATGYSPIHDRTANTVGILDYLHEFKQQVAEGKDIFTVGEANGVTAQQLPQWVGKDGVFDMIFQFSHLDVKHNDGDVWYKVKNWRLTELKQSFRESQENTAGNGWYPIFLENHDQPRSVNSFIPGCKDMVKGAKALGMLLMTMRGTPFLYQGEELGMTNVSWTSIDSFNDLSTKNQYNIAIANGLSDEHAIYYMQLQSRDNARTPMHWDDSKHAGFTSSEPWLAVNDNYLTINAAAEEGDPDSVLNWYKQLAQLRRKEPVLIDGSYEELLEASEEIFAYRRQNSSNEAVVLINFSHAAAAYDAALVKDHKALLSNYAAPKAGLLRPYEAVCWGR